MREPGGHQHSHVLAAGEPQLWNRTYEARSGAACEGETWVKAIEHLWEESSEAISPHRGGCAACPAPCGELRVSNGRGWSLGIPRCLSASGPVPVCLLEQTSSAPAAGGGRAEWRPGSSNTHSLCTGRCEWVCTEGSFPRSEGSSQQEKGNPPTASVPHTSRAGWVWEGNTLPSLLSQHRW